MKNDIPNSQDALPPTLEGANTPQTANSVEARRRLLRAGLAAGPVLLAVKSRSVLAAANDCTSDSVFASLHPQGGGVGAGISHHPQCTSFSLKTPEVLSTEVQDDFYFFPFYSPDLNAAPRPTLGFQRKNNPFNNPKLAKVLSNEDNDNLRKLLAAAVLNKRLNLDTQNILPDEPTCKQIWRDNGRWRPAGSTRDWRREDTIAWLQHVFYG